MACFSFHPRKLISTGDGGMITSSDSRFDAHVRGLRQHAMSVSDLSRHSTDDVVFESYLETGFNYRLTDIQAAIGQEQLKRLPAMVRRRRELAARYGELLTGVAGVAAPGEPPYARTNWQSYIVRLADAAQQLPVMRALHRQGIATRRGIMCAHLEPPYQGAWPKGCLPQSEAMRGRCVILPLYHQLELSDQERVVAALSAALGQSAISRAG
jgi:dTDP-4-amino-4,6-dideoxygalactose transaminase